MATTDHELFRLSVEKHNRDLDALEAQLATYAKEAEHFVTVFEGLIAETKKRIAAMGARIEIAEEGK
jgi:hypothetical protein